jgi:hypothetical protein
LLASASAVTFVVPPSRLHMQADRLHRITPFEAARND